MTAKASGAWQAVRHVIRCARTLAISKNLPVWLRVLFVIGCVQIPVLPVDEICLCLAVGIMAVFYRPALRTAWNSTRRPSC